ncbi:hypothetical protein CSKR_109418 [Clonorchis sinensis]|uniref:Uncharacterized protein n=1 Tax=Clonorchis sinensis TaxID=79923 RepID=A0A8T1MVR6_CLOSI|nr:hypothetical protein CSKR_109418 [Clonorchis sinensis]
MLDLLAYANVGRSKRHWSREFKDRRIASQLTKVCPFIYAACRLKIDPCEAVKHAEEPFAVYCVSPESSEDIVTYDGSVWIKTSLPDTHGSSRLHCSNRFRFNHHCYWLVRIIDYDVERDGPQGDFILVVNLFAVLREFHARESPFSLMPYVMTLFCQEKITTPTTSKSERSSDSGLPDPKSTVLERAEEPMGADVCLPGVFAVSTPESVLPSSTALGLEQELSEPSKTANQGDRDVLHRSLSTTPSSQNSIPSNLSSPASPSVSLPAAPLTSQACSSTPFSSTSIDVISTVLPTCTLVSSPISYPAVPHSQCSPEYYTPLEPTEPTDPGILPAESTQRSLVTSNWDPTPIVHPSVNGDAGSISESLSVTKNNPVPICDTSILQAEDASIDTSSNANSTNSSVTRIFRSLLDFLSSQAGQFVRRFSTGRTPQLMAKPTGKAINYSPSLQSTSGSERAASIPDSATKPSRFFVSSRHPRLVNSILNRVRRSVHLRQKARLTVFHQANWAHTNTHRAVHADLSPGCMERHALVFSPGWPQWTLLTSEESAEIITSVTPDHLDPSNRRIRSLPTHYPAQTHHSPHMHRRKRRFAELQPLLLKVMNDIAAIDEIKLPICSTRKLCELTDRFVYRRQCT